MRMGIKMARQTLKMKTIFEPLEANRKANIKGRVYIYLIMIGIPLYLETATERNIRMYERRGFRALNQIPLLIIHLPQWGMVREPKA